MPQTITQGQRAPAGWVITQGVASSGVCQDPNGCYAEQMNAPAPAAQPAPQATPAAAPDMTLRPATATQMLGLPQQPQTPQMCTPETGCRPATINLAGSAQRVVNTPGLVMNFAPGAGSDPWEVMKAKALWGGYNTPPDYNKAVATAGIAGSQSRAAELMGQGVDYQTAIGLAQREAMDNSGYRAAGIASGSTGATTGLVDRAARLEAERQFMRGGQMSAAGRALFPASSGTIFTGPDGQLYQSNTSATPQTLAATPEVLADPFTAAALLSGQSGLPLARVKAAQTAAAQERRQALTNAGALERVQMQGQNALLREQTRRANRTNRTWMDKLDAQTLSAVQDAYEASGAEDQGIPMETFYDKNWKPAMEQRAATLPQAGTALSF